MVNNTKRTNLVRFSVMGAFLITCIWLEYYFHFLLRIEIVYTHLFYIPIVLAALWWGLKGGLPVSLFLASLHIIPQSPKAEPSILFRGLALMLVGSTIGIISDWHKRVERELHKRKEMQAIFLVSGDGMRIIDTEYKIINQNEEMDRLFGIEKGEAVGKKCSELCHTPLCNTDECPLRQILLGVERVGIEMEVTSVKGKTTLVNLIATAFKDDEGKVIGVIENFRDITERKQAEETLKVSEEKYSTLVEKGNDGVVIIQDGLLKFVNSKMTEFTGFAKEEVVGRPFLEYISPEHKKMVHERYKNRLKGEEIPSKYEIDIIPKDGSKMSVEINASLIEYEDRPADMAIIRDITERKKTEEELAEYRKHLEELVKERTKELGEKNAESERLNKLFVGRELRMVELKEKMAKLEKEVKFKVKKEKSK